MTSIKQIQQINVNNIENTKLRGQVNFILDKYDRAIDKEDFIKVFQPNMDTLYTFIKNKSPKAIPNSDQVSRDYDDPEEGQNEQGNTTPSNKVTQPIIEKENSKEKKSDTPKILKPKSTAKQSTTRNNNTTEKTKSPACQVSNTEEKMQKDNPLKARLQRMINEVFGELEKCRSKPKKRRKRKEKEKLKKELPQKELPKPELVKREQPKKEQHNPEKKKQSQQKESITIEKTIHRILEKTKRDVLNAIENHKKERKEKNNKAA